MGMMGMSTNQILGSAAVAMLAVFALAGASAVLGVGPLSMADVDDEEDLEDIVQVEPELTFLLSEQIDTGTFYMAEEEMEDYGHYIDFEGEDADEEEAISEEDRVTFPSWLEGGSYYTAVTAEGYHAAFQEATVDSMVDPEEEEIRVTDYYQYDLPEKKADMVEEEVMIYDDGEQLASTEFVDYQDGDEARATFEVDEGVAYIGEISLDTTEEVDFTVYVDGEVVEDVNGEVVDENEAFEVGDGEDPVKAYDDVEVIVEGYDEAGQEVAVDNIYEDELFNLMVDDEA